MYPGDPEAPYSETANCRCTLVAAVDGVDTSDAKRWSKLPSDMSYEGWKGVKTDAADIADLNRMSDIALARTGKEFRWVNEAVSALSSKSEVKRYLEDKYDANILAEFDELSLSQQKDVAAALDRASELYGKPEIENIGLERRSGYDGSYDISSASLKVNKKLESTYIAAFHESVHAIDVRKSLELERRKSDGNADDYSLHSFRVLSKAKKEWAKERREKGMKAGKNAYDDELLAIFGYSPGFAKTEGGNPAEVIAYALDLVESGSKNRLAFFISKEF